VAAGAFGVVVTHVDLIINVEKDGSVSKILLSSPRVQSLSDFRFVLVFVTLAKY
jgi:hypothetical protein